MESYSNFMEGTSGGHLTQPCPQNRTYCIILFPAKTVRKPGQEGGSAQSGGQVWCPQFSVKQCHAQRCPPSWGNLRGAEGVARSLQLMRQELMGPKSGAVKSKLPFPIQEALGEHWAPGALPAVQGKQDTVWQPEQAYTKS